MAGRAGGAGQQMVQPECGGQPKFAGLRDVKVRRQDQPGNEEVCLSTSAPSGHFPRERS